MPSRWRGGPRRSPGARGIERERESIPAAYYRRYGISTVRLPLKCRIFVIHEIKLAAQRHKFQRDASTAARI